MARRDLKSLDMIRTLISYDTTSRDSNLALIDFVRDYLSKLGVESELIYDDERRKANLYATLGPKDRPGICLSGHTDVVPVDGQEWSSDPFKVIEKNGKLYGRGTCDMKSWLAVALAYAPEFLDRGLETPIHLAFSYDEEVGCIGVRRLITQLKDRPNRPIMCIVGEPTGMKVVRAHKGKRSYYCRVRGFEAHSSLTPRGVNAIEYAAEIIMRLKEMGRRYRDNGPYDQEFDVPYTTVHTGVIHGGTQLNIVPKDCVFEFEFRHLPTDDPLAMFGEIKAFAEKEIIPQMQEIAADTGVAFQLRSEFPGLDMSDDDEATALVKRLTGANATAKVAFGTEAGLFQNGGIPTIICGPGEVDQAHKPDEFVALDQIALCEDFMARIMDHVCSRNGA